MIGTLLALSGAVYIGYRIGSRHAKGESIGKIIDSDVRMASDAVGKTCDRARKFRGCRRRRNDFVDAEVVDG